MDKELQALQKRKNEEAQILELGKIANASEKALDALQSGMSYKDFSFSLIQNGNFSQNPTPKEPKRSEVDFSLANYALSIAKGQSVGEITFKQGANGLEIPNSYYTRFEDTQPTQTSTTNTSTDTANAGFIPEYYRGDKFIEQVFAESNILALCDRLSGLVGTLKIPRDNSSIKAYWVKEGKKTTLAN